MFTLKEILQATGGRMAGTGRRVLGTRFKGVSIDSRTVKKREVFIAIRGGRLNGHDFITDALDNGASAALVTEVPSSIRYDCPIIMVKDTLKALGDIAAYHRKKFDIPVMGITGSNGKTTVKEMTSFILSKRFDLLKNKGTENNLVGLPLTLLGLRRRHAIAILEMGTNCPGEIGRLAEVLKPSVGLITNVGHSHLEFLKDRRGVLREKSRLVRGLKEGDIAVLNGDDNLLSHLRIRAQKITFGLMSGNDFRATDLRQKNGVTSFTLNRRYPVNMKLLGLHNVYNALAAIAASSNFRLQLSEITGALSDFRLPIMRMEVKKINGIDIINDAYNSNPLSLRWAVEALSNFKRCGKKILVSGDMLELGKKSRFFHIQAGRMIAGSSIDALIAVGNYSRFTAMAAGRAGMRGRRLFFCRDTKEAAGILKKIARHGDAVLVKGSRGMAMERVIERL